MIEKIQIYISIIAALAITITSIIKHATLYDMALRLIVVIILFYFIGIIVKHYLIKNVFPPVEEPTDPEAPLAGEEESLADATAKFDDIGSENDGSSII